MSSGFIVVISIVSMIIWSTLSLELLKEDHKDRFKIVTLMSAGTLTTLLLTVSLFENMQL